jgi:hypothetical protein
MNRSLVKYVPPRASDRGESFARRGAFHPFEDARMDYGGAPDTPGLRAFLQRRRVEQIRARARKRHRAVFGTDE